VYVLDGTQFTGLASFATHFSEVVLDGHLWHGNLDALDDILRGGFGTPTDGFVLRIENASAARAALGYRETALWFEERMQTCHPSNREAMAIRLAEAQRHTGPTLFDMLLEIIEDHGPGGSEPAGVILELE